MNLNSKLNNMLNAKKININSAIIGEAEKERKDKEEKQRRNQIEYDPQCPNQYELVKHQYLKMLEAQTEEEMEEGEREVEEEKEVFEAMD